MGLKFSNFGKAIVASAPPGTAGLSFTVEAGKGLLFPSLGAGDYFYGIFKDASGNREVVKISARNTDSMTIDAAGRGLDGTAARTWAAGDYFVAGLTNIALQESLSNANLVALGALATASDKIAYWTGAGAAALSPITSFIRGLFAADDAVAARTTLGAAGLAGDETIAGNKTFPGISTFTGVVDLSATVLKGAVPLALDGATPGGSKTSISVVDPTANRTITVPDADIDLTKIRVASTTLDGVSRFGTPAEAQAGALSTVGVTPAGLNATVLGMGQTYQDMTAGRSSGVTYTNSTGRSIIISVWGISNATAQIIANCYVNGVLIALNSLYSSGSGYTAFAYFIVPPSATYSITFTASSGSLILKWFELR